MGICTKTGRLDYVSSDPISSPKQIWVDNPNQSDDGYFYNMTTRGLIKIEDPPTTENPSEQGEG